MQKIIRSHILIQKQKMAQDISYGLHYEGPVNGEVQKKFRLALYQIQKLNQ